MADPAADPEEIARRIRRLSVNRRDPEAFFEERDELAAAVRALGDGHRTQADPCTACPAERLRRRLALVQSIAAGDRERADRAERALAEAAKPRRKNLSKLDISQPELPLGWPAERLKIVETQAADRTPEMLRNVKPQAAPGVRANLTKPDIPDALATPPSAARRRGNVGKC